MERYGRPVSGLHVHYAPGNGNKILYQEEGIVSVRRHKRVNV